MDIYKGIIFRICEHFVYLVEKIEYWNKSTHKPTCRAGIGGRWAPPSRRASDAQKTEADGFNVNILRRRVLE
jgi:hypothetical protein